LHPIPALWTAQARALRAPRRAGPSPKRLEQATLRDVSTSEIDPALCPLCGAANDCGMARGQETCWCFDATISSRALERVPEAAKGVACVCKACAADGNDESSGAPSVTTDSKKR
jgi:hypothetical protein